MKKQKLRVLSLLLAVCLLLPGCGDNGGAQRAEQFQEKAELLAATALSDLNRWEVGDDPLGSVGYGVFFSVCNTTERASVYSATGETLNEAWNAAVTNTAAALKKSGPAPVWVKVDIAYLSENVTVDDFNAALDNTRAGFLRYGVSFDSRFETALLEAELNSAAIYDYENNAIDLTALNQYLKSAGRKTLSSLPENLIAFKAFGWLCDENNNIYTLESSRLNAGRRIVDPLDDSATELLVADATDYLIRQITEDGSFVYGYSPCFGKELSSYNILRHAGTLWALACRYRTSPSEELEAVIRSAVDYLRSQVVTNGDCAYIFEEKSDEIKLGGCGLAIIALTECADLFPDLELTEVCRALGRGILSLMDLETGEFWHVLNPDFSRKEEFRTVYYDGEATFALCRLYGLTREQQWLDAARISADHFIAADYTQYGDHWVSYAMNELTKYITDEPDYFVFALYNAQRNLQDICDRETAGPTDFELLMVTFMLYVRMTQSGFTVDGFDIASLLLAIRQRADAQLDAFFFPELAMYMQQPQQILGAFMARNDSFRTRIDDVQHSMAGLSLYAEYYELLVDHGMLLYQN